MAQTFHHGGIHPPDNKFSAKKHIEQFAVPKTATIPVSQHLGAPAKAIVKKGDYVKVGTKIAEASGFVSANLHSPVSGKVKKVDELVGVSGYAEPVIIIDVEGDEWDENIDRSDDLKRDISQSAKEIVDTMVQMGIVGLGGATFPTHVKLSIPEGKTAKTLIINAVECEPYLTADHRLMLEHGPEIMVGTQILMKALGVDNAVIGIESNKPDAIEHFTRLCADYDGITVQALQVKYPQGGEKQLISAILKTEVPSGGLPIDVGVVVQNVGTVFAVYEAVQKNKPLIDRVVTVTGKSLANPSNFRVRIGTSIGDLIEACGGLPEDTGKVVNGGPMMGKALTKLEVPVTKGTSGVLIVPENEAVRDKEQPCIRCGKCVVVCPANLEPYLIAALAKNEMWDGHLDAHAMDCIECASCTHMCPAKIPLLDYCRMGKNEVRKMMAARK